MDFHVWICCWGTLHRKKSFSIFPSPAGMSLTKLSLGRSNLYVYDAIISDLGEFGK